MTMSDYIKIENAVKWFQGMLDNDGSDYDIGVGGCIAAVKRHIPSEDVEPVRHGEWYAYDRYSQWIMHYKCSECNAIADDSYKYCPYCGAKMEVEEDE